MRNLVSHSAFVWCHKDAYFYLDFLIESEIYIFTVLLSGDAFDVTAKQAYRSLLRVTLTIPENQLWLNFTTKVKQRAQSHYNFSYDEPVSYEVDFHLSHIQFS